MNDRLTAYIDELNQRVAALRDRRFEETAEDRLASEAVADALEAVARELTGVLEVR